MPFRCRSTARAGATSTDQDNSHYQEHAKNLGNNVHWHCNHCHNDVDSHNSDVVDAADTVISRRRRRGRRHESHGCHRRQARRGRSDDWKARGDGDAVNFVAADAVAVDAVDAVD
jgi:hypothetical protein